MEFNVGKIKFFSSPRFEKEKGRWEALSPTALLVKYLWQCLPCGLTIVFLCKHLAANRLNKISCSRILIYCLLVGSALHNLRKDTNLETTWSCCCYRECDWRMHQPQRSASFFRFDCGVVSCSGVLVVMLAQSSQEHATARKNSAKTKIRQKLRVPKLICQNFCILHHNIDT